MRQNCLCICNVIEKSVSRCASATFLSEKCYNNSEEIIWPESTLTPNVEKVKHST